MTHEEVMTVNSMRSFIDKNKISFFQWKIIIICFFIVLLDGFDIAIVVYIAPFLKKEMALVPSSLSYLFVSGILGLMLGSMILGPLADKFGRKKILIFSTFIYGTSSILCGAMYEFDWLLLFRFLTGIGLGGAMPVCITLCAEYSPQRYRMLLCTLSWSGFTVGIAVGGIISNLVLQQLSWHWLFYLGGVLPILCVPLIVFALPESLEFLIKENNSRTLSTLVKTVKSINKNIGSVVLKNTVSHRNSVQSQTVMVLFKPESITTTILLWLSFFFSLFVFYLLTYWIPIIFDGMYDYKKINFMTAMLPLGGTLGALSLALWIDYKKEAFAILASAYFTAMALLLLINHFIYEYYGLLIIIFMIGFTIAGAQNGLNLISASLYPSYARATGVSWAMASGRLGSITGTYLGAWLIKDTQISLLFCNLSIGTFICGLALIIIFVIRAYPKRN